MRITQVEKERLIRELRKVIQGILDCENQLYTEVDKDDRKWLINHMDHLYTRKWAIIDTLHLLDIIVIIQGDKINLIDSLDKE